MREPDRYPAWVEKTQIGQVAAVTLGDGEHLTGELTDFDIDNDQLVLAVFSSSRSDANHLRVIPIDDVDSYEPAIHVERPWPYNDPCRALRRGFSLRRFFLWLAMFGGFVAAFIGFLLLVDEPLHGQVQALAAAVYTICATWFTFAEVGSRTGKDLPSYSFTCPAVRTCILPLTIRHLGFLVVLVAIQTGALAILPYSKWWEGHDYFMFVLMCLCAGVFFTEVFSNRRLLSRAHEARSSGLDASK